MKYTCVTQLSKNIIFFSVPCEDDEERRGSLTTARRGSRLSDIIQMQVGDGGGGGHDSDGQDEDDDVNYIYCDDNDTFVFIGETKGKKGSIQGQAGIHLAPLYSSGLFAN